MVRFCRFILEDWSKTGFRFESVDDSLFCPKVNFCLAPRRMRHWEPIELGSGWLYQPPKRRQLLDLITWKPTTEPAEEYDVCEVALPAEAAMRLHRTA